MSIKEKTTEELSIQAKEIREELWNRGTAIKDEINKEKVGKVFKTRNTYGGDCKGWWLYTKVVSAEDGWLTVFQFQECDRGLFRAETIPHMNIDEHNEISDVEFMEAWMDFNARLRNSI